MFFRHLFLFLSGTFRTTLVRWTIVTFAWNWSDTMAGLSGKDYGGNKTANGLRPACTRPRVRLPPYRRLLKTSRFEKRLLVFSGEFCGHSLRTKITGLWNSWKIFLTRAVYISIRVRLSWVNFFAFSPGARVTSSLDYYSDYIPSPKPRMRTSPAAEPTGFAFLLLRCHRFNRLHKVRGWMPKRFGINFQRPCIFKSQCQYYFLNDITVQRTGRRNMAKLIIQSHITAYGVYVNFNGRQPNNIFL